MTRECRDARRRLTERPAQRTEHLEHCEGCARFAERVGLARRLFREHHAGVVPDAGFAERVAARLPRPADTPLAWAAARLLPVPLALLLVLAWVSWQGAADADPSLEQSPTENVLTWVIDRAGDAR